MGSASAASEELSSFRPDQTSCRAKRGKYQASVILDTEIALGSRSPRLDSDCCRSTHTLPVQSYCKERQRQVHDFLPVWLLSTSCNPACDQLSRVPRALCCQVGCGRRHSLSRPRRSGGK